MLRSIRLALGSVTVKALRRVVCRRVSDLVLTEKSTVDDGYARSRGWVDDSV